ncbi:MAG: STAS domain-containing protein [Sulfitobacter sp.]
MEMSVKTAGHICVVTVEETRIDAPVALAFKDKMRTLTRDAENRVLLDLTQVTFIDSSGLGAIVAVMKHLAPDRKLLLAGLTPAVEKVFNLTRMNSVFTIFMTLEEALEVEGA